MKVNVVKGNIKHHYIRASKDYRDSILDINDANGRLFLSVFPGNYGGRKKTDILVTYYSNKDTLRIVTHIEWVADILMKYQGDKKLTIRFVKELVNIWNNASIIRSRSYNYLKKIIDNGCKNINITKYKKLNDYGFYKVDMIVVLILLLSYEEKNSSLNARYLGEILDEMTKPNPNFEDIVYKAS